MDQHQGSGRGGYGEKDLKKEKKRIGIARIVCGGLTCQFFFSFWFCQYKIIPDAKARPAKARHYYTVPFPTVTI